MVSEEALAMIRFSSVLLKNVGMGNQLTFFIHVLL